MDVPPQALAYCRAPCLACSSGVFPGIGILMRVSDFIVLNCEDVSMDW
jgi:hypothetical protein